MNIVTHWHTVMCSIRSIVSVLASKAPTGRTLSECYRVECECLCCFVLHVDWERETLWPHAEAFPLLNVLLPLVSICFISPAVVPLPSALFWLYLHRSSALTWCPFPPPEKHFFGHFASAVTEKNNLTLMFFNLTPVLFLCRWAFELLRLW